MVSLNKLSKPSSLRLRTTGFVTHPSYFSIENEYTVKFFSYRYIIKLTKLVLGAFQIIETIWLTLYFAVRKIAVIPNDWLYTAILD